MNNLINAWAQLLNESVDSIIDKSTESYSESETSGKPNIIFCDIDGVLVNLKEFAGDDETIQYTDRNYKINLEAMELLKTLCQETNSKVVINSSWNWYPNGKRVRVAGADRKLRSRLPEVKRALGDLLFDQSPIVPPLSREEIPGAENIEFDEDGTPLFVRRTLKSGEVKEIDFNPTILKPFCVNNWLNQYGSQIGDFVSFENNVKSQKWACSKVEHGNRILASMVNVDTGMLTPSDVENAKKLLGVSSATNTASDDMDIEVSESETVDPELAAAAGKLEITFSDDETYVELYDDKILVQFDYGEESDWSGSSSLMHDEIRHSVDAVIEWCDKNLPGFYAAEGDEGGYVEITKE